MALTLTKSELAAELSARGVESAADRLDALCELDGRQFLAGDGSIDIIRLTGVLSERRANLNRPASRQSRRLAERKDDKYQRHRENMAARQAEESLLGREIGAIPHVVRQDRVDACRLDLRKFCETYFPKRFFMGWSPDQLKSIAKIETAILKGALYAFAMPRGFGKTSLCIAACIWAILYGHWKYVMVIGAEITHAKKIIGAIKKAMQRNTLLIADFPSALFPIYKLSRIAQRAQGQLCHGVPTDIEWTDEKIVMPSISGSPCAGSIVEVRGITAAVRGMFHDLADGTTIRPDGFLIDDPQTKKSAKSDTLTDEREEIIKGDVLGSVGPGTRISALMPMTVIKSGDLADRMLDHEKHPEWRGERMRMVNKWPDRMDLWEKYHDLWKNEQRDTAIAGAANEFYLENKCAMDLGAEVPWAENKGDCVSALQFAMHLRFTMGDEAFFAELQNDPVKTDSEAIELMSADEIAEKLNGYSIGTFPASVEYVTAFIDVQDSLLYWVITGWTQAFSGYTSMYGTFPQQKERHFTLRKARIRIESIYPNMTKESAIASAIEALTNDLLSKQFVRADGVQLGISRCLVDSGYFPDLVYEVCRRSAHRGILMPSKGESITCKRRPMSEFEQKQGQINRGHWIVGRSPNRALRYVRIDTNYWKSFVHARYVTHLETEGSLSLFGKDRNVHRMFAEHQVSEHPIRTSANGRTVDEFERRSGGGDNHFLDCQVGCAVAASICGAQLKGITIPTKKTIRRVPLSEMRGRPRGA